MIIFSDKPPPMDPLHENTSKKNKTGTKFKYKTSQ